MASRPDLIQSELAGLAFDSTQELFRPADLDVMFTHLTPPSPINSELCIFIDPAAGGPHRDYAVLSVSRHQGILTVWSPGHAEARAQRRAELAPARRHPRPAPPPPCAARLHTPA